MKEYRLTREDLETGVAKAINDLLDGNGIGELEEFRARMVCSMVGAMVVKEIEKIGMTKEQTNGQNGTSN